MADSIARCAAALVEYRLAPFWSSVYLNPLRECLQRYRVGPLSWALYATIKLHGASRTEAETIFPLIPFPIRSFASCALKIRARLRSMTQVEPLSSCSDR